ncbi:hypothetical protein SCD92_12125 [Gilvimarinus sp. SDUM040013]|uniref:Uncharacterized protein n=1 Tax=Gilvimarinus gilvus TaxID=3058038 RepID=A0ABU4RYZ9_9GAMM|nr:hypothetical protein [Gilvimarinus sp. SDUM040013]MDX6850111.1 hypothetical protein [Gilvimarinus sp. SDUM040013]
MNSAALIVLSVLWGAGVSNCTKLALIGKFRGRKGKICLLQCGTSFTVGVE